VDHAWPRSTVDRPWTAAPGSLELRPPAAPVSKGVGQGAGEEEWNAGSSGAAHRGAGGSVVAGHRGGTVVVEGGLGGEAFRRGRGEERSSVRGGMLQGSSGAFIGAGGRRRGVAGVTAALMALTPFKTGRG
jgi:hypothetical protein